MRKFSNYTSIHTGEVPYKELYFYKVVSELKFTQNGHLMCSNK